MQIDREFWLPGGDGPASEQQLDEARQRLIGVSSELTLLLAGQNGGVPRRSVWCPQAGERLWRVMQFLGADSLERTAVPDGIVFAVGDGEFILSRNRVLVREAQRIHELETDFHGFLRGLSYDDSRWLVGIRHDGPEPELTEKLRAITGGVFQKESEEEEGYRARHGSLHDTENGSRHARLYIYPNRGDYPEAPDCDWILEAAIRVEESDAWKQSLAGQDALVYTVIHAPHPLLVREHTDMAMESDAPVAPPPGVYTDATPTAVAGSGTPPPPTPEESRFDRGLARLTAIHGDHGRGVMKSLEPICPDLARFIIEFPFGDIYTRPGLDPKSRQIATMASLVTLGHATSELKSHIRGSLNIGVTRTEIVELILQMSVYAGFPAAINGMRAAQEVFEQLDEEAKRK